MKMPSKRQLKKSEGGPKKAAAREFGISESTLRDRLKGAQPLLVAKEQEQKLSPVQALTNWVLNEGAGRAPTRRQVQSFAEVILSHGGSSKPLGLTWIDRFIARNPQIKLKPSESLEAERAAGTTVEAQLRDFWGRLEAQIEKSVGMTRIYNFDETGIVEGEFRAGRVLGEYT